MAIIFSLGAGVLTPLVITVMGEQLDSFGGESYFFELSPKEISQMLKENNIDLSGDFHPTVMKFVYFGIAMLVANYVSQALWVFTSEVICRVLLNYTFI